MQHLSIKAIMLGIGLLMLPSLAEAWPQQEEEHGGAKDGSSYAVHFLDGNQVLFSSDFIDREEPVGYRGDQHVVSMGGHQWRRPVAVVRRWR